jgi:outer membrane receptor protein involved in Fe transport
MAKSRSLQQAVRFALATATAAAGVSGLHAQEAPAPAAAPVEEVVVTGSRLSTPNETSISPITSVSATDLQQTGLTRVEDVLNNLPMVFAGQNSTTSNGADGTATIDLRGLGNQRTLVLVNGRRLGPGTADGRNFSDINQVPAALIERIDVLTGGASAVYGADAVAGVVNFILNTRFQGLRVDAGYNFHEHSNSNSVASVVAASGFPLPDSRINTAFGKNASILMGSNFADNKGNATFYLTYDNQGSALQGKFDYSSCNLAPADAKTLTCGGSSTSRGGSFRAYNSTFSSRFLNNTVDPKTGAFRPFTGADLYNFAPLNFYQTPNERWTSGGFLNYDLNPHLNAYAEVMFTRNQSDAQIAPSGDFGNGSFIPCANPLLTAAERATLCSPANLTAQGNPTETVGGVTYPGINIYLLRRNVEGGPRDATFVSNSFRSIVGLKGEIGDAWRFDAYAQHSTVDIDNGNRNYLSNPNIIKALNVLPGPGGAPTCASVIDGSDPACVPWNVWVPNGVTPAAIAYMSVPLLIQGNVTEQVVSGSITGDLGKYGIKLPSADQGLQINVGVEWRSEAADFLPDALSQAGSAAGSGGPTPAISGNFHVREAFTELRLPLAQHAPFAEDLSLEGGYRYSEYSLGFNTNTYKLGLEWAPVRDLRARASYQRAVRAPNIGELFTPQVVGLDGSSDACSNNPPALPTASLAACQLTGVTPAQYGHIAPNAANQYNGLLGGNPNLKPETADTYSVGLVLQPRVVPNLSVSVDYFNIKVKEVIGPIGGDTILNNCLASVGNPAQAAVYCPLVHRDPAGTLWLTPAGFIRDLNVNLGELTTKGLDFKASYRLPLPALGSLLFGFEGTKLQSLTTTPVIGGGSYDCTGFFGSICGAANPSWRHVLNATWSTPWDGLDLSVRWRYIGSDSSEQTSSNSFLTGSPFLPLSRIPTFSYIDLTGTFNLYKNVRLELGVNNIVDKNPPLVVGGDCSTSSPAGANCNGNTFPGVYDAMGRYLFAHISAQF